MAEFPGGTSAAAGRGGAAGAAGAGEAEQWVDVLVNCPELQGLLTYRLPPGAQVRPGDVLSVPLRDRLTGGIAVRLSNTLPPELDPQRIRAIDDTIASGFFSPTYWTLLERVAEYYRVPLASAIELALPPGLLRQSQRRVRLRREAVATVDDSDCSEPARAVLALLRSQKDNDYSARYVQQQVKSGRLGMRELQQRGWLESYLEPPQLPRPKQQQAVLWLNDRAELTPRQSEVLEVLRRAGGQMWLSALLRTCCTSTSTVTALARKGCVSVRSQEVLRRDDGPAVPRDRPKDLTPAQARALAAIAAAEGSVEVLLHGVTGSGKTEVYLQAIAPVLAQGKSALVLVPEIGLTPQLLDRFRARFGEQVRTYHSGLSEGERYDTWRQLLVGTPQVAIGTRSAVFVPLPNLGAIVLDEEHDTSFKQTRPAPTYHARTVARWRAEAAGCPLILGSATPALTTWHDSCIVGAEDPARLYLSLPERVQARSFPAVEVVDMTQELERGNRSLFSHALQGAMRTLRDRDRRGILFVPRRCHSTFVSCRSCGHVMMCPQCDVSLSYHFAAAGGASPAVGKSIATGLVSDDFDGMGPERARARLRCHYCNFSQAQPPRCPACESPFLKHFGSGTQRVVREVATLFPHLRCLRFDSDTTRTKGAHRTLLEQFARGEADLLVGTQMLTKGLDLPQVALVAAIAADGLLFRSDFAAAERAFQTLTQVVGRTGRGEEPGRAIVQTYVPEHPVVQAVRDRAYKRFALAELEQRKALRYPPFGQLVLLQLSGVEVAAVAKAAATVAAECDRVNIFNGYEVLGPAPAAVERIARRYRWQVLLKVRDRQALPDLQPLRACCPTDVSLTIDVDPLDFG
ncbi:primosomal protein N' [Rubidibacter lacunae KORDI 51-2]|uniref:Replication restart protein PriA n=1 Tax=Rubidibacter lacunae KORDI 51-2 TaxID=582515 RepID=U5DNS7_9CHRO|nr:primosomal protein N' [Rubidibacter lacunae]ERN42517.1 primosomal protein N' [Rubidibacter lacunae KORDI 51-2]